MKRWYVLSEIVGKGPILRSLKRLRERAAREDWIHRPREGRGGGREYLSDDFPADWRAWLAAEALRGNSPVTATATEKGAGPACEPPATPPPEPGPLRQPDSPPAGASSLPAEGRRDRSPCCQPSLSSRGTARPDPVTFLSAVRDPAAFSRADARFEILGLFEPYLVAGDLPLVASAAAFASAYNSGGTGASGPCRRLFKTVSGPTILRWRRRAAAAGASGLAERRGRHRKGHGRVEAAPELRDFIVGLIGERPHVSAKHVMQGLRARFGYHDPRLPSYRTVQRFLTTWKAVNANAYLAHTNPDSWKGKRRIAFGDAAGGVSRLNQCWEMDATPADVMCPDGRHAVVGLVDVYSRRAMVLVSKSSRSESILALLRRAILEWGVPESVKTDQGKDFTSVWTTRALAGLGIRQDKCPPFTPECKPHIERFFGTLTRGLFAQHPAFVGHDVAGRKDIEARRSFAERFGSGGAIAVKARADELQEICDRWIEGVYHLESHSGLKGKSPFEAAAAWGDPIARIDDERALDVMLAEAPGRGGVRTVGKKGIALENTYFIAPELAAWVGRRVHIRLDAADMGRIYVFDAEESEFVCVAEAPERTGADRRAIAARAREIQKAITAEGKKEIRRAARAVKAHTVVDEILAAADADAAQLVQFPKSGAPHETPGLTAAADAIGPKRPEPGVITPETMTDEDRASADSEIDRIQERAEGREENVVPFRRGDDDEPPVFSDSPSGWLSWALDHPDRLNAQAWDLARELLSGFECKYLLGIEDEAAAAARLGPRPNDDIAKERI